MKPASSASSNVLYLKQYIVSHETLIMREKRTWDMLAVLVVTIEDNKYQNTDTTERFKTVVTPIITCKCSCSLNLLY